MREILFKAKRTDNKEWVEGYPFPSIAGKELNRITVFEPFPGGTVVNTYEIDPETVCQYIGKKDKNDIKIFESDNVKVKYFYLHELKEIETYVSWCEEDCSFTPFNLEYECDRCECYCEIEDLEVVGNIHDKEE